MMRKSVLLASGMALLVASAQGADGTAKPPALPVYREATLPWMKAESAKSSLTQAHAAARDILVKARKAAAAAFANDRDSFQFQRLQARMTLADRLTRCIESDLARGDVSSLCFAEMEIEDLKAFAKYVDAEVRAWKTSPENPAMEPVEIRLRDFGAKGDGVTDDSDAFRAAIAAVKALNGRPSVLRIGEGVFLLNKGEKNRDRVNPDHVSNIVFPAISNCIVTGVSPEKTKIRFGVYDAAGIYSHDSYNSVFRDFEIRWRERPFFQGTILGSSMEEGWFEVAWDEGSLAPTDPKWKVRNHPLVLHSFEPDGTLVKEQPLLWWDRTTQDLGGGRYRLGFYRKMASWKQSKSPRPGVKVALPDRWTGAPGMKMIGAILCKAENIWIRNGREAFLVPSLSYSFSAVRCRIFPDEGFVFSTNADGFYNPRGSWISDCEFRNMGDDGCNSHGRGGEIAKIEGSDILFQGFSCPFSAGDMMLLADPTTGEYLANLRVKSGGRGEWNGKRWYKATVEGRIPEGISSYATTGRGAFTREERAQIALQTLKVERPPDLVFAPWSSGIGYVVKNNVFANNRNTAMVVQCPNALLEGNRAEGMQNGMMICQLLNWNEGPAPYNVVVRNNVFADNFNGIAVRVQTHNGKPARTKPVRHLVVEGNAVSNAKYSAFSLDCADAPVVSGNRFDKQ